MKRVFKYIVFILLGVIIIGTFVFLAKKSRPAKTTYELVQAKQGDIIKKTVATGMIEARNEIQIKPQISGIIDQIYKESGEMVNKDEIIARVKVIPDMVSLNAAQSRLNQAEINWKQAEKDFNRQKELVNQQIISREEYEKALSSWQIASEEYEAAQNNYELTLNGITQKSGLQSNTLIRSTIDGMILDIPVKVGNSVIQTNSFNEGTTIATVADMNDMLFIGKVDETEVGRLQEGMPIVLSIGALNEKKINARLEYIAPKGSEENGAILFEIKAAASIPKDVFVRAGYSANAEIVLDKATNVITLPESVIEFSGDTSYVYVLRQENPQIFQRRIIRTGLSDGIQIEVTDGLKVGEKVRGALIEKKKLPA
jgi:HlyD family secretion protein